ncbi:hypothetical protein HanLR1_Chr14g0536521 [Helianthus annuus]|nr:hypothetical protein HanLR1_Chr14g0536521 [Helianthus annuus]
MCFVHVYFCQFKFDLFHLSLPPSHPATIHSPYICLHQPLPSSPTTNPSLHVKIYHLRVWIIVTTRGRNSGAGEV